MSGPGVLFFLGRWDDRPAHDMHQIAEEGSTVDTKTTSTFADFTAARVVPGCPDTGRLMVDGYLRYDGTGLGCTQILGGMKQAVIGSARPVAGATQQVTGAADMVAESTNAMVRPHVSTDPHPPPRGKPS